MSDKTESNSNRSAALERKMLRVDCDTSQEEAAEAKGKATLTGPTSSRRPQSVARAGALVATDCDVDGDANADAEAHAQDMQVAKLPEPCKTNGLKGKAHKEEEEEEMEEDDEEEDKSPLMSPASFTDEDEDALALNDRKSSCNSDARPKNETGTGISGTGNGYTAHSAGSSSSASKQQLSPGDKLRYKVSLPLLLLFSLQ